MGIGVTEERLVFNKGEIELGSIVKVTFVSTSCTISYSRVYMVNGVEEYKLTLGRVSDDGKVTEELILFATEVRNGRRRVELICDRSGELY